MYFCHEYSKRGYPVVYMKLTRDQGNDRVVKVRLSRPRALASFGGGGRFIVLTRSPWLLPSPPQKQLKFMVWMLENIIKSMDTSQGVEKMAWITDFKGTGMR